MKHRKRKKRSRMQTPSGRIVTGLSVFFATFCVGTAGYMFTGANLVQAAYMVVITVFSVGYEETIDLNTPGRQLFTMGIILVGCSSLLYVTGGFIQMVMEGELDKKLGERMQAREIEQLSNHAIVCGFGRMGQIIARELELNDYPFVVIELEEERIEAAALREYLVIEGDATDERVLALAGIERASNLATVLPSDAMNVFITLSAHNMNPKLHIMARGEISSTEKKLRQAGANQVVLPAAIGGIRIAHMIVQPTTAHLLDNLETKSGLNDDLAQLGVRLVEETVRAGSKYENKTVGFVEGEREHPHLVVAVRHADGEYTRHPAPAFTLKAGDTMVFIEHAT